MTRFHVTNSYPGDTRYLAWLSARTAYLPWCAFATAPDVVGAAAATLTRSLPMLQRIRAALVAQDGLEHLPIPWGSFDVLFLGGTTEWKLGPAAARLTAAARRRGVTVHMGRVNSLKRLRYAASIGCHSADGTFLAFGPDRNLPRLLSWLTDIDPALPGVGLGVPAALDHNPAADRADLVLLALKGTSHGRHC